MANRAIAPTRLRLPKGRTTRTDAVGRLGLPQTPHPQYMGMGVFVKSKQR